MATQSRGSRTRLTPTQARAARRARRRARRRFLRWGIGTVVGAVALAFIAGLFLPGLNFSFGSSGSGPDGPGLRMSDQGQFHIELGQDHPAYNSAPATSGWHYEQPLAPVRWGVHDGIVADEYRIHNLEHGGVGVHYNCPEGCPELVERLAEIVNRAAGGGLKVMMSPYPDMQSTIALTAWTFIDQFEVFDEQRIKDFIDAHESSPNAPEYTAR